MKYTFKMKSENAEDMLALRINTVSSPSALVTSFRHLAPGFYGELDKEELWLLWYESGIWTSRSPRRFFEGKIIHSGTDTEIVGRFRFTGFDIFIYLLSVLVLFIAAVASGIVDNGASFAVFCAVAAAFILIQAFLGIYTHKKCEKAVIDFLSSL